MGKKIVRKDVQDMVRYAESLGFRLIVKAGRSRHIRMQHEGNGAIIMIPSTPSAPTWKKNCEADIRRYAKFGRPTPERS